MANLFDQIPKDGYPKAPTADGSQNNPLNTEVGRNLSNLASAIPGAAGVPGAVAMGTGLAARALGASAPAVGVVGRAAQAAAPYAPVAAGAVALNSATSTSSAPPPSATPSPTPAPLPTPVKAPNPDPVQVNTATPPPLSGGPISVQNTAAQPPAAQPQNLAQAAGVIAPTVRNSTNDWASRKALENAATAASSITANGGNFDQTRKGQMSPQAASYAAMLGTDQALQQAQPGMAAAAMRENAGIQREGMQLQGANTRSLGQIALEQQKINQAGESQGFANRAAAQSEQLRNVLLDPNATPEQRSVAQRNLAALSGKTAADRMQVVNLPDTDNGQGQVLKGGQALVRTLEDGTVEQVPIGGQRGATAPLANHVAALKANPKQAAQFDEIYGPGAAARAIGK